MIILQCQQECALYATMPMHLRMLHFSIIRLTMAASCAIRRLVRRPMQQVVSCKQVIRWVAEKTPLPGTESFPAQAATNLTALTIWISSDIRHQNPLMFETSSTGVARPKMETRTTTFPLSGLMLSTLKL